MAFAAFKHKTFGALPLEMERRPFTPTDILEPCTFSITIAQQAYFSWEAVADTARPIRETDRARLRSDPGDQTSVLWRDSPLSEGAQRR